MHSLSKRESINKTKIECGGSINVSSLINDSDEMPGIQIDAFKAWPSYLR